MELELNAISLCVSGCSVDSLFNLELRELRVEFKLPRISFDRHEANTMGQILIWDDAGVLPHIYLLNGHCGDLSNENSPESVSQRRFSSNKIEDNFFIVH